MKKVITMVAAVACTSLTGTAGAQAQKMRPGLWEHSFTMKSQSGQIEKAMSEMHQQMASMPPEQRKMMEQSGKWLSADCGNIKPARR